MSRILYATRITCDACGIEEATVSLGQYGPPEDPPGWIHSDLSIPGSIIRPVDIGPRCAAKPFSETVGMVANRFKELEVSSGNHH